MKNKKDTNFYFTRAFKHIDFILSLIKRIIDFNDECKREVMNKCNIPSYAVDYRIDQFDYYKTMLANIYYNCHTLKNVNETSFVMRKSGLESTIEDIFDNQRRHITFSSIVMLTGIFEYCRKQFEANIKSKNYIENLVRKFPKEGASWKLLIDFRNTIHQNGKWHKDEPLTYRLIDGERMIKKGEVFLYEHRKLFILIKDCIVLHKLLALESPTHKIYKTRLKL